ncbi:MFS transporter [Rhizobium sp.]|jgi:MFS family permease|uniref:MFS transporter n=1 Tax=Rhizobium sp. TaxID=391 RepID=UPI000E953D5E|nr:MFS transporter [Rhizobium sp.]
MSIQEQSSLQPRRLNSKDFKTLGVAALGGALEFYDFIIFVFFAGVIGKLFFPPDMPDWMVTIQTFGIFAAGYLVRPIGGIVLAHLGDIYGRKAVFNFSILLMAVSTLGMAAMPTYSSIGVVAPILLVVMRLLQGAAIGGEVPGAWTFVSEHVPFRRVGLACGFLCSGLTLGILLGALIAAVINSIFPPQDVVAYAWRIPFFLGGIFGLTAVFLRRWLQETPVFQEMRKARSQRPELPLKTVLRDYTKGVIISMLLTWVLSACLIVTTLMTATLLQKLYGYSAQMSLAATSFGSLFLIVGTTSAGALIDKLGSGRFFLLSSPFLAVTSFLFYSYAAVSVPVLFGLYGLMGLSVGMVGGVPYVMVRAFPAHVRFSGLSFSYNLSYAIFGGLTPIAVSSMIAINPMAPGYYIVFIAALAFAMGLYLLVKSDTVEAATGIEELTSRLEAART